VLTSRKGVGRGRVGELRELRELRELGENFYWWVISAKLV
jgi:hypothetical protein